MAVNWQVYASAATRPAWHTDTFSDDLTHRPGEQDSRAEGAVGAEPILAMDAQLARSDPVHAAGPAGSLGDVGMPHAYLQHARIQRRRLRRRCGGHCGPGPFPDQLTCPCGGQAV